MKAVKPILIFLALVLLLPRAAADDGVEKSNARERRELVELWLDIKKREAAAAADRITGRDTFTKRSYARQQSKPRRYTKTVELLRLEAQHRRLLELTRAKKEKS